MTLAAWMNSVLRERSPCFERRPKMGLPPVLYGRGTSPNQAPKSRPRSKASPSPTAATMAVEIPPPARS